MEVKIVCNNVDDDLFKILVHLIIVINQKEKCRVCKDKQVENNVEMLSSSKRSIKN